MRIINLILVTALVSLALINPCKAQGIWAKEVVDPVGDATAAYDITSAKAWHDGTTLFVTLRLASDYSSSAYTVYAARIRTSGPLYGLAFVTASPYYGPMLGVSYDNGGNWGFAGGSPSGSISPTQINLQIPMANLGARPWEVDFISGVWWYFNNYTLLDTTSSFTIPPELNPYHVEASQRKDGSQLVDIYYDLWSATPQKVTISLAISANGGASYDIIPTTLTGEVGANITPGLRRHIIWDVGHDRPDLTGNTFKAKVTATTGG